MQQNQNKVIGNYKNWVVVKFAANGYWNQYFVQDPKIYGVNKSCSVHNTYTGMEAHVAHAYMHKEDAEDAAASCNKLNPTCGYAACPLFES